MASPQNILSLLRQKTITGSKPYLTEDYRLFPEVPFVEQISLPAFDTKITKASQKKLVDSLYTPKNIATVKERAARGADVGGQHWYNVEPMRAQFIERLGVVEGNKAHDDWLRLIGVTSGGTPVDDNILRSSMFYANPSDYGHPLHRFYPNLKNVMQGSLLDPQQTPKTRRFYENLRGNYDPATIDRHNLRSIGWQGTERLDPRHYFIPEAFNKQMANEMGMQTAPFQSALWVGDAARTGVKNPSLIMSQINDRIAITAKNTGKSPKKVLDDFINRKAPLHSFALPIGGVGGLLESMGQFESLDDGFI